MPRTPTGKRLRFEVFKRDQFTCQYCGSQPPAVVLVIDHIIPVKEDGQTAPENLITACEVCNQGKGARSLGHAMVRPDADLMYLEVMQEEAELRRYASAIEARETALAGVIGAIQRTWLAILGEEFEWVPGDAHLRQMLTRYNPEIVDEAVRVTGAGMAGGHVNSRTWFKYMWAVARNIKEESDA